MLKPVKTVHFTVQDNCTDVMFPATFTLYVHTVCPRSCDPFHIVSYFIEWVTTSWTYNTLHIQAYKY